MQRQNTLSMASRVPTVPEVEISGLLHHLDKSTLQKLHDNEDSLLELINDLPQTKTLQQNRKLLETASRSVAEYNVSLEPRLKNSRQELILKHERAQQLRTQLETVQTQLRSLGSGHSLDAMHAVLQTKHAETDERAEEMASDFVEGKINVGDFLEEFLAVKKLSHLRRIKAEKMGEIVNGDAGATLTRQSEPQTACVPPYPPARGDPAANGNPPYPTGGAVPYPTQPGFGMPQPRHGASLLS